MMKIANAGNVRIMSRTRTTKTILSGMNPRGDKMITDRMGFIGASDCAAVLGLSRFKTVLQVWAEKTGTVEPEDISEKLNVWLGNELEEVVAKKFTKDTGKKVHRVNDAYVHKNHDFIRCHIDRKVEGENAILQCKTASAWMAKHWEGEEIPQEYILQEYHELACTNYERAYIAVLIGNNDFKIKVLERDENTIKKIIAKEVDFWENFVIPKVIPKSISARDSDTLFQIFPDALLAGEVVELGEQGAKFIEVLKANQQDLKVLEDIIDQNKNELKAMLGDSSVGKTDNWMVTWRNQVAKKLDVDRLKKEAPEIYEKYLMDVSSRVLRLKEIKKGDQ